MRVVELFDIYPYCKQADRQVKLWGGGRGGVGGGNSEMKLRMQFFYLSNFRIYVKSHLFHQSHGMMSPTRSTHKQSN